MEVACLRPLLILYARFHNQSLIYLFEGGPNLRFSNCLEVEGFKHPFTYRAHRSPILCIFRNRAIKWSTAKPIRNLKLYTIMMPSIDDRSMDYFCNVCQMKKLSKPCKKCMFS
ncbi:hypothetical protein EJD97_024741 [Solanum chilense]|uniref:Uncharacterized protein n=1 Tax=Solanum chilense TaxID=4083 RepID=A0A6N2C905_SOLCI|nr:hypothetical protein EJD97_024741 [Solanum chilense]